MDIIFITPVLILFINLVIIIIFLLSLFFVLYYLANIPKQRSNKKFINILLIILFIEAASCISIGYLTLPDVAKALNERIYRYTIVFNYLDYKQNWIDTTPPEDRECLSDYINQKDGVSSFPSCESVIKEYKRQKEVFGQKSDPAILYLSCKLKSKKCKGITNYIFPSNPGTKTYFLPINIEGELISKDEIDLYFTQPESILRPKDGKYIIRPSQKFKLKFEKKDRKNSKLVANFIHPKREINIARVTLEQS